MPPFDQAFATLIRDLDRRKLLDSTLVCVTSEFGRTPKINGTAGRDHWPKVFSIVMAGGGIARGTVYGSSDATASEPLDNPLTVEDWATTVYHCLGIVADKELMAPGGRPVEIVDGGQGLQRVTGMKYVHRVRLIGGLSLLSLSRSRWPVRRLLKPPRRSFRTSCRPACSAGTSTC